MFAGDSQMLRNKRHFVIKHDRYKHVLLYFIIKDALNPYI